MSKLKVVKGLQAEIIMGNMSAQIVRQIVGSILEIDTRKVHLSGILPESFEVEAVSTSGMGYSDNQDNCVWAFCPKQGLVKLNAICIREMASSNANGTWESSYGYTYEELALQAPEAIFFVVMESRDYSDDFRDESSLNYTLYKSADFKEYWAKVDEQEIARWQEWIVVN